VKLTDFGASKAVGQGTMASRGAQTMIGTPFFMAPEVLLSGEDSDVQGYGKRADIWSLGITLLEMLQRGNTPWPPFPSTGAAFMHIASPDSLPIIPERLSDEGKDFMRRCCCRDPKQRATAEELLSHPWLRGV
jgi:serine/threonine protein kinase